ncbi:MAG: pseudouridine synthase [Candidatus Marinimicrobia bacterium]|nr:pseudouridine synthase [Candidatus Neomarinimicrobiota bacterium]|tara:strand:+ start:1437 stop:2132 length:696 start_codon:yes stop_codon:yes gene_type:complete
MRLNKFIAKSGITSRRKADHLISQKLISVNGEIVSDFSYKVSIEDIVTYKGKVLSAEVDLVYVLFKPKGYVCSNLDKYNKKNVFELIDTKKRLFTIGRLDRDTTGVILITNNGDLAYKLTHPKFQIVKKYSAITRIDLSNENIEEISRGIKLDDGDFVTAKIKRVDKKEGKFLWDITLREGKNREIKKIFHHFDSKVISLHRYKFSNVDLKSLDVGSYRKLNKKEIANIAQ